MTEISITIPGAPVAKGRVRVTGSGTAFTPMKTVKFEGRVRDEAALAMQGKKPLSGPLCVRWTAYFAIPASWPAWKRGGALSGVVRHTSKPDADNLLKCKDALNGIVWLDDSQVVSASVTKEYSETPRTEILIFAAAGVASNVSRKDLL